MSVATETIDLTIVDGLIALPDKPAAAAQPGASCQWQMLQPAGPPPAPPEAQIKGVSTSNDLWIGALRPPRSSHLTRSGGLGPVDSPLARQACRGLTAAEFTHTTFLKSSVSKSKLSSISLAHSWPHHAGSNGNCAPVSLPRAWRNGAGTNPVYCASARRAVGQAVLSKGPRLPLLSGRQGPAALRSTQRFSTGVSSRQAITAPGGREPTTNENGSQRS